MLEPKLKLNLECNSFYSEFSVLLIVDVINIDQSVGGGGWGLKGGPF